MAGKRTYRTSQGKTVDLGALLLQNENTRAVGNMGVNARGDRIDNRGKVVDSKVQQTKRQYNKQIGPVDELPATSRRAAAAADDVLSQATLSPRSSNTVKKVSTRAEKDAKKAEKDAAKKTSKTQATTVSPSVIDIEEPDPVKSPAGGMKKRPGIPGMVPATAITEPTVEATPVVEETQPVAPRGLADAIARARSIKQEQAKTPRQLAQEKAGVRKI